MRTQASLARRWDHFRQIHGIALRVAEKLPEDRLDSHPIPRMRTPKELVVHLYGMILRNVVVGALEGRVEELDEAAASGRLRTRAELLAYCHACWEEADRAVAVATDERLASEAATPWGFSMPAAWLIGTMIEEFLHHRGQLYVYLRALGERPPDIWDFENNAPEFRPRTISRSLLP